MDLRSARVSLRPWQRHDDDVADEWPPYNDPFDCLWNLPRSSGDSWSLGFETGVVRRSWAVEDWAGRLIGRISLRDIDERKAQARLGITFGAPFVSQGLGTEALRIFLDSYFAERGFHAMVLDVAAPNQRAVRCYRRLGFQYISSDWRPSGVFFDSRVLNEPRYAQLRRFFRSGPRSLQVEFFEMRLLKEEWFALRQPL
jgi:RimJ/RimL family protein N-acetyltransferase